MNGTQRTQRTALAVAAGVLLAGAFVVLSGILAAVGPGPAAAALGGIAAAGWTVRALRRVAVVRQAADAGPRVIVVGTGSVALHLAAQARAAGCEVLGHVEDGETAAGCPVLGTRGDLVRITRRLGAQQVIVADPPSRRGALMAMLEREEVPAEIFVVPELYELALCAPAPFRLGDVALFRLPSAQPGRFYERLKRMLDLGGSVVLLLLFAPLLLLAMLVIRLTSPGAAIYRQQRVGKDGRPFEIFKLRTMVLDAELDGPRFCKGSADPRLTPVGRVLRRTHLDELPQLWNVLRGEMSLVGPRPERPCFVEQFESDLPRYSHRHRILPGITGLAQVNGFYHSGAREKLRYDLMYLYHRSLWMDLAILWRTLLGVLR